ncbi:hypothetical protein FSP39_010120 [Pinctada imbricata]|uniref:Tumor necrosis factor receptor superfamily member 16 n=1 Tax=Pinctada imbricata TaxID=66713 RepID=A0AA88XE50_PINIB|nr:hypothetical protein FSP39_010120 [Pinctada imbricata]
MMRGVTMKIWIQVATNILVVIAVSAIVYEECGTEEKDANSSGVRCCKMCNPGEGVVQRCTNDTDTVCASCARGSFSPNVPHSETCKTCKKCGKNAILEESCSSTQDTICKCKFNYYLSLETGFCALCNLCPIAVGAKVRCAGHTNSECEECADGYFSDVRSAISPCKPCTMCNPKQFMLQNCTRDQDTICLDFRLGITDSPRAGSQNNNIPNQKDDDDNFDVIPIYCSVLGAVVAGLLVYVIFKHYTRLKNKKHHKVSDPHADIEYSKASGGDSGVFVETDVHSKAYNQLTKVRDLPIIKKKSLSHMLAFNQRNRDDWKALANLFGYTCGQIERFEVDRNDQEQNAQRLLDDWSRRKHATVGVLVKGLSDIGRLDAARFLLSDMQKDVKSKPEYKSKPDHKVVHVV